MSGDCSGGGPADVRLGPSPQRFAHARWVVWDSPVRRATTEIGTSTPNAIARAGDSDCASFTSAYSPRLDPDNGAVSDRNSGLVRPRGPSHKPRHILHTSLRFGSASDCDAGRAVTRSSTFARLPE